MYKEQVIVIAKEFARLLVLAIPGILIQVLSGNALAATTVGGLILGLLKGYDKSVHDDPINPSTGLLPF